MPDEKETSDDSQKSDIVTMEKVNDAIQEALKPIRDLLSSDNEHSNTDESDSKKESGEEAKQSVAQRRRTFKDIEKDAEELVAREVQKVLDSKEHEAEHKRIERERSKKETEVSPVKERRLTRLMLGKGYQEEHTR